MFKGEFRPIFSNIGSFRPLMHSNHRYSGDESLKAAHHACGIFLLNEISLGFSEDLSFGTFISQAMALLS